MGERRNKLLGDTRGLSSVEYIILTALIGIVGFGAWQSFGVTLGNKIGLAERAFASAHAPSGPSRSGRPDAARPAPGGSGSVDSGAGAGAGVGAGVGDGSSDGSSDGSGDTDRDGVGDGADIWGEGGALGRGTSTGLGAVARGVADGALDVVGGAIEGTVAMAGGVWDAVTHPSDTAAVIAHAVTHPSETAEATYGVAAAVVGGAVDAGTAIIEACAGGDGYACSRGVTNAVGNVIPVGAAGTVARGGKAVSVSSNSANRLRSLARDGTFADAGGRQRAADVVTDHGSASDWRHRSENIDEDYVAVGPQTIVKGQAVNTTTGSISIASRAGDSFEISGHANRGGTTISNANTTEVARVMVDQGGYRGGDVVLRACESACSPIPGNLRRDLNIELERAGHEGRVGTIAAPTHEVNGVGDVREGGHWELFEDDTPDWTDSVVSPRNDDILLPAEDITVIPPGD